MATNLLPLLSDRVLILDGAMGTNIHRYNPSDADWGGRDKVNLCDYVGVTHPDWIRDIHRGFLAVGCDAVETNTFNGCQHVLAEFGLGDQTFELNRLNTRLARQSVEEFSTRERPRFVIGSVGPGTKQPSINNPSIAIDFDDLYQSYAPQMRGLIEGGCDAILIETCFDILQAKCAAICALDAMNAAGIKLPLMVQVTILEQGKMLAGSDMATAIATLESLQGIDVIGINCALGPADMVGHIQQLSKQCKRFISCLPNAGLPENVDGHTVFPLKPVELAEWLGKFVREYGVNIVGGCCGTTFEHLAEIVRLLRDVRPTPRQPTSEPMVTCLLGSVSLHQEPRPLLVGERTNTNGSRKFKQLLEADDWDGLVEMGRDQEREGVHVLDVCTAFVGRDEVRDMVEVVRRYNEIIGKPLMVDTTEPNVLEAALKRISGKALINSINLEEGRAKIDVVVPMARRYGAALVALTIDEQGQATTADWKFQVAERIYKICTQEYGIPPTDLLFDPLVFPVTTGQEDLRTSALETLNAIRLIKSRLPGALTHIGLSNVSFGLSPYARQVVNSVFLHYALEYGLDSAILHAAKIIPLARIDEVGCELARRLLFNERDQGDPLQQLIAHYGDKKAESAKVNSSLGDTVEERLKQAIIQGRRETLIADLDNARSTYSPLTIINTILLDGMKVVGELFGSGQMQLPFVLQSAEVMKAAVSYLEQYMEKIDGIEKGKIVLATVKGDVHDIGKNLVDIILSNNGYKVVNLGIKQPIENMIRAFEEHKADAIGMSGLLVKSTVVMKEDLITLNQRGLQPVVILGGAALTRRYVEVDLRKLYQGSLYYGEDAFEGLRLMDQIVAQKAARRPSQKMLMGGRMVDLRAAPPVHVANGAASDDNALACCPVHSSTNGNHATSRRSAIAASDDVPAPPFIGSRIVTDIPLQDIFAFLNERTLFSTQWQFRRAGVPRREYERQIHEVAVPALHRLKQLCLDENILRPSVAYGFFPCISDGDELMVFTDAAMTQSLRFEFPRQVGGDNLCLSDYFRANMNGEPDIVSMMAVTMGHEISRRTNELFRSNQYTDYLFLHGLGVESAEALAEYFHQRVRREWGIASGDGPTVQRLFKKQYRGCRYSFGYPACPNLEDQTKLFELLHPERIGLSLSEQFQLEPEQSTTALIVHHPKAKYFNIHVGGAAAASTTG
jgi:5-methyltetrahydrofolate--homocysteine methyltransferase